MHHSTLVTVILTQLFSALIPYPPPLQLQKSYVYGLYFSEYHPYSKVRTNLNTLLHAKLSLLPLIHLQDLLRVNK